jgi:hypothetical protein
MRIVRLVVAVAIAVMFILIIFAMVNTPEAQ